MSDYLIDDARAAYNRGDNLGAIAAAVLSLASNVEAHAEQETQEDFLRGKWDECDAALGRVLELADELDGHPHATLKPTAFRELAERIRKAIDHEGIRWIPVAADWEPGDRWQGASA